MDNEALGTHEQRRVEASADSIYLHELIDFASEVCFGRPLTFEELAPSGNPEASVVAKFGVRGLRMALDLAEYGGNIGWSMVDEFEEKGALNAMSPLRKPEDFSGEMDLKSSEKIVAFGRELLDTAYLALGTEVRSKVRAYQQASSDQERWSILEWVNSRIDGLASRTDNLVGSGNDGVYEPYRLSPRLLGVYPHHEFGTTCLGNSVIVASFLEQAGARHMHAGVVRSSYQAELEEEARLLQDMELLFEGAPPQDIEDSFSLRSYLTLAQYMHDTGYHAANYVRLDEGWAQIDRNYNANVVLANERDVGILDRAYGDIAHFRDAAPGLERSVHMPYLTPGEGAGLWVTLLRDAPINTDALMSIIDSEDESIPAKVWSLVRAHVLEVASSSNLVSVYSSNFNEGDELEDAFYRMFNKYVLWDGSLEEVAVALRTDDARRVRLADDLARLPTLVVVSAALALTENRVIDAQHDTVEVGDPAHRVGAMVLQDFAAYYDDRLSPTFWLTHTSSYVPVTEVMDRVRQSAAQEEILRNNMNVIMRLPRFAYAKSYGIIAMFLAKQEEGQEDAESRSEDPR